MREQAVGGWEMVEKVAAAFSGISYSLLPIPRVCF